MSQDAGRYEHEPVVMPPQRPGDQFPGFSGNIMATFYRDELRATPRRRSWPLLLFPAAFMVFIGVTASLSLPR